MFTAPSGPVVLNDFHPKNRLYITLLVSICEMGEALRPLVIASLSKAYGRLPVLHVSNLLFICFVAGCASSTDLGMLIIFRFLSGCASAPVTVGPGIIGDVFPSEKRSLAMSLNILGPLIGPVAGPVPGDFLVQAAGWWWPFWVLAIAGPYLLCQGLPYRGIVQSNNIASKSEAFLTRLLRSVASIEIYDSPPKVFIFRRAIVRPTKLAALTPIVLIVFLYASVVYGYSYANLTTLTEES